MGSAHGGMQDVCGDGAEGSQGGCNSWDFAGFGSLGFGGHTGSWGDTEAPRGYRTPRASSGVCRTQWVTLGGQRGPGASGDTPGARRVFLVRESQRNPKGFVLSLCHLQRIKHYLILPVSASPGLGGSGETGRGVLTCSPPAERGGGSALLHHGRRADALRRPHPARGVPPDQPWHPALQAAALLHLRGPLSHGTAPLRGFGTAWHHRHGRVWLGTVWHCWHALARSLCRHSTAWHHQHGTAQPSLAPLGLFGTAWPC